MTLLPPAGAPDWSQQPVRASALLSGSVLQHWPNGNTALPSIDVSRYNGVMVFVEGQAAGPMVRITTDQTDDPAGAVILTEQFVVTRDTRPVILQCPVVGRYLLLSAIVAGAAGPTAAFAVSVYGTSNPWVPPSSLRHGLVDQIGGAVFAGGQTVTLGTSTWTPGRHRVVVGGTFTKWHCFVDGYDEAGTLRTRYIDLFDGNAHLGLSYPFTVAGFEPILSVTNDDGGPGTAYLAWGIDP